MKITVIKFFIILSLILRMSSASAMDSRAQAVVLMTGYGTVGGALLGAASLAFGASGRSVAKGASIGLYCGLLFGGYIVMSHQMRQNRDKNPEPVPETDETYDEGASEGIFGHRSLEFFRQQQEIMQQSDQLKISFLGEREGFKDPLAIRLNLINLQF